MPAHLDDCQHCAKDGVLLGTVFDESLTVDVYLYPDHFTETDDCRAWSVCLRHGPEGDYYSPNRNAQTFADFPREIESWPNSRALIRAHLTTHQSNNA